MCFHNGQKGQTKSVPVLDTRSRGETGEHDDPDHLDFCYVVAELSSQRYREKRCDEASFVRSSRQRRDQGSKVITTSEDTSRTTNLSQLLPLP